MDLSYSLALEKTHQQSYNCHYENHCRQKHFLPIALNEPEKEAIIKLTAGSDIISPEILQYEIDNALSAMVKRKRITKAEAISAQSKANVIPVRLVNVYIL